MVQELYQSRESSKKGKIMKITKEVITNQTQQSKKSRGLKAAPSNLLGDVKLKKGNLKQDMVSFGSPVIYQEVIKHKSHPIFIKRLAKFIDKFEEKTKKNKQASVDSNFMSSEYLGHGMSGNAYVLYDGLHAVDQNILIIITKEYIIFCSQLMICIQNL